MPAQVHPTRPPSTTAIARKLSVAVGQNLTRRTYVDLLRTASAACQ